MVPGTGEWVDGMGGPEGTPPTLMKVFHPGGKTCHRMGWLVIGRVDLNDPQMHLTIINADSGNKEGLDKRCVVVEETNRQTIYDPRNHPPIPEILVFMSDKEREWLKENRHWPAELELTPHPVEDQD